MKSLAIVLCYRAAYLLHHAICLRPGIPLRHSRLVVIGAYRTGGAGKTPFCTWLAETLSAHEKHVAILCHEYAYDEAAMLREHFAAKPQVKIFTTRNRYRLAHELDRTQEFDFILCDDGFEDSRLVGATTFVLLWENAPTRLCELWPLGNARSLAKDHSDHHSGRTVEIRCNGTASKIRFAIDNITNRKGEDLRSVQGSAHYRQINIFCGIGDPERLCNDIREQGIAISGKTFLKDHDRHFSDKLQRALQENPQSAFVITEKDAARLEKAPEKPFPWPDNLYIARQKTIVDETLAHRILYELLNS
ncbi:tetraacyldisaccharide 4'-kinase [Fibrobacter sp.]|uniref:tetraacyldisaccharide 4'-kinase n=1 Tax=Fibrobacter sp. TaxID=35828 RepID=UPI002614FD14|nr:tetraacyldisaccharide 4'-kinase [Fibrobacter sp.]MDD5941776.1 tetraacyldisaccharide 4'-kinase [Fibrobacter sp.]